MARGTFRRGRRGTRHDLLATRAEETHPYASTDVADRFDVPSRRDPGSPHARGRPDPVAASRRHDRRRPERPVHRLGPRRPRRSAVAQTRGAVARHARPVGLGGRPRVLAVVPRPAQRAAAARRPRRAVGPRLAASQHPARSPPPPPTAGWRRRRCRPSTPARRPTARPCWHRSPAGSPSSSSSCSCAGCCARPRPDAAGS